MNVNNDRIVLQNKKSEEDVNASASDKINNNVNITTSSIDSLKNNLNNIDQQRAKSTTTKTNNNDRIDFKKKKFKRKMKAVPIKSKST